jgi:hypothetical protein
MNKPLENNISRIDSLKLSTEPTFKNVFGDSWDDLPIVMKKHYVNRPYSKDRAIVEGTLDIMCAGPIKLLAPLFWLMGNIPPRNENGVAVTVYFDSDENSKAFHFNRIFYFKNRKPYHFRSRMVPVTDNEIIELMRFGFGWRMNYCWEDNRVKLKHKGYVFNLFGYLIPMPLTFFIGEGNAEEVAIDDNTFAMDVRITHSLWGEIYGYKGQFKVTQEI